MNMRIMKMIMLVGAMMMGVAMGNIVNKTCKQTPDYNLCLSLLRSDPRSSSADIIGLSLILVEKIKAFGTETLGQINGAYKMKPTLKRPLDECNQRYKTIVYDYMNTAIIAIKGNPKFAESTILAAGVEASICEKGFPKGQSPLTGLPQRMEKICEVTRAITRMLL